MEPPKKQYRKKENIIVREEGEGAFLFDPATGNLKYMNRTALEIFSSIEGTMGVDQMLSSFQERYPEADPEQLSSDMENFLHHLEAHQFISAHDNPID